jgi:hypothetical protein
MNPNTNKFLLFFSLLFFISTFFTNKSKAQNFTYSSALNNLSYTQSKIIGRVKNNIIVWMYTYSSNWRKTNSDILVYDNEMKLIHKTSFKPIVPEISSISFLNEGNSFAAVLQYPINESFIWNLIRFDADGNIVDTQTIAHAKDYELLKSEDDKSFALERITPSEMNNAIAIKYVFVKNDAIIHADKFTLPFDTLSCAIGKAFLTDDKLIFPVIDSTRDNSKLTVYKLNLSNNSSSNTIRKINNGYLNWVNIDINESDKYYQLTSQLISYDSDAAGAKIFTWQLNKDLTDKNSDTLLCYNNSMSSCLQNIYYYKLNSIALRNNTSDVLITAEDIGNAPIPLYSPSYYAYNEIASYGSSFYEGRVLSMIPQKDLNGNGIYMGSNVSSGPTWGSRSGGSYPRYTPSGLVIKPRLQTAAFAVLNVDAQNKLNWSRCFNASEINDISYLIKHLVSVNTPNALHIIYSEPVDKNNRQSLTDIVLHADGSYTMHPIISMNLKYSYMVEEGIQLDENSVLFPCVIKGKRAFAKYTIE